MDGSNSHEEIEDSNSIMNNLDLMNISKILYAPKTEYYVFINVHGIISRNWLCIHTHIMQKATPIQAIFSDHSAMRLEINN